MELRQYVNNTTSYVNENTLITIRQSTGFTVGLGQKQIPTYAPDATGYAQIQAADSDELEHIEGMNLQGTFRNLYISSQLYAVVQPLQKGGDLILIGGTTWLVVKVIEDRWPTWCKVLICLQSP
jgi:hypothetical protein